MKINKNFKKNDLREVLVDFLPEAQQAFRDTKAYVALCDALWDYINSDHVTRAERLLLLAHEKEIFDHMCLTTEPPEPKIEYPDPERPECKPWYWQ